MENFKMFFCQKKSLKISGRQSLTGRIILNAYGYMASTGKQYQNHAATIISWARQDHPASRQRNYESEEYETL